jgi:hypothetical protein
MAIRIARLVHKLTGSMLGGCAVGSQLMSVLVCIALIAFGPGVIV